MWLGMVCPSHIQVVNFDEMSRRQKRSSKYYVRLLFSSVSWCFGHDCKVIERVIGFHSSMFSPLYVLCSLRKVGCQPNLGEGSCTNLQTNKSGSVRLSPLLGR